MNEIGKLLEDAKPAMASFDEAFKVRGKKRQPAIDQWFETHGDHAFAMTYTLLNDKSKSRRELGAARLVNLHLTPRNREAMGQMCQEILAGNKSSLYPIVLNLLGTRPVLIAQTLPALASFIVRTPEATQSLSALSLIASSAGKKDAPTQAQLAEVYDNALDHWAVQVQERAAELLAGQGGQPRPSMWHQCPLSESVRRHISRLGGTISGTPDPDAPRPITQWGGLYGDLAGFDPSQTVSETPWPIAYFSRHVHLPHGLDDYDRDYQCSYGTGSANSDVIREGGATLFLHAVLSEDNGQWEVTLDLTDTSGDPRTQGYDHAGWLRGSLGSLSKFLSTLKSP